MTAPTLSLPEATFEEALGWVSSLALGRNTQPQERAYATALTAGLQRLAQTVEERDQARQMLADAPHSYYCGTVIGNACSCWKAGL
jgi:hypothetical protein